jgi:hypothetical protein
MFFAFLVGAMFGFAGMHLGETLVALTVVMLARGASDVALPRTPFVGAPSPYLTYRESLGHADRPWIGYLGQTVGWGLLVGFAAYLAGRSLGL